MKHRRAWPSWWLWLSPALVAMTLAGCASVGGIQSASRVTVYVSMPLRGPSGSEGRDVVRGAKLALADAHGKVSELRVRGVYLDDTSGSGAVARWDPVTVAENARRATEDSTAIAYIGEFDSGATRTSEPITNEAHLLQVSPASTAVDLVQPFPGSQEVPNAEPTGDRTFGRVIPDDQAVAEARRAFARQLGTRRVAVLAPTADVTAPVRNGNGYAVSAAEDPSQLPPAGQAFVVEYRKRYGSEPGRYAAYGYEAMAVVLDSIKRAGGQGDVRQPVIDAFFATTDRHSVLGTYSIDDVGDTTLGTLAGYRLVAQSRPVFVRPLRVP